MPLLNEKNRPLVSVGILTYNHEKYIAEAIESVLRQKVNFKYEIVIAEDCSTDNTRNIVIEYQKKYPDIIRLILQPHNVGMQENSNILRRACRGFYRANLEGDDYWAVDDKLQQQVDFLEMHPDFIAIGGEFKCIDDFGKPCKFPWGNIKNSYCFDEEYTKEHLKKWLLFAHTSTMCFRNVFYNMPDDVYRRFNNVKCLGDRRVCLFLIMQGRIKHEKKIWAIRRVLKKSKTSFTSALKNNTSIIEINHKWLREAERYSKSEFNYNLDFSLKKQMWWLASVKSFVKDPSIKNYRIVKNIFLDSNTKIKYIFILFQKAVNKSIDYLQEKGLKNSCCQVYNFLKKVIKFIFSKKKIPQNNRLVDEFKD